MYKDLRSIRLPWSKNILNISFDQVDLLKTLSGYTLSLCSFTKDLPLYHKTPDPVYSETVVVIEKQKISSILRTRIPSNIKKGKMSNLKDIFSNEVKKRFWFSNVFRSLR